MTRFSLFTDEELDYMESAFCNEGLKYLVEEVRRERRYRESMGLVQMKLEVCDLCRKNSPDAKIKYKYKAKSFLTMFHGQKVVDG